MADYKSFIIDEAERELKKRRELHEGERKALKKRIYEEIPRIKEIDSIIRTNGLDVAREVRAGRINKQTVSKFKKELTALSREKRELLKEHNYPPKCLELKYTCNKCHDTGIADNEYCKCRDELIRKIAFRYSGLEKVKLPNFDQFNLEYYDTDYVEHNVSARINAAKVLEFCMNYTSGNILFEGPTGLGKTFISGCIAKKLLAESKIVCYMSAPQMFSLLNEKNFSKEVSDLTRQRIDFMYSSDYLIIDDLGTEFKTSFTDSCLFDIINSRIIEDKSTIINSNISLDGIMESYSERVSSRLAGEYKTLKLFGRDIRKKKKRK